MVQPRVTQQAILTLVSRASQPRLTQLVIMVLSRAAVIPGNRKRNSNTGYI